MCCFDCELMPKLQHIRVAGKEFDRKTIMTNYSIFTSQEPSSATLRSLDSLSTCGLTSERCTNWTPSFSQTPLIRYDQNYINDMIEVMLQDIINIYKDQLGVRTVKHEELESPKYTTSVPSSLAA